MLKQMMRVLIIHISLIGVACAEVHWWKAKEVPRISGYIDNYAVAINSQGKMISLLDEKIVGMCDANSFQWRFLEIDASKDEPCLAPYSGESKGRFNMGKTARDSSILLDDSGYGCSLVVLQEGAYKGHIAAVMHFPEEWPHIELISEKPGSEAALARAYDGRMLAVWINKEDGLLMSSYYDGDKWIKQGAISSYTSVEMNYNQIGPQLVMNDLGDAVVIWKIQDKQDSELGHLVAEYFDGVEEKWVGEHIIASQSIDKKGRHIAMNFEGEVVAVWNEEVGIVSAHMNLMKYMGSQSAWGSAVSDVENTTENPWTIEQIVVGEDLNSPKVCLDRQGNGLAIWIEGYSGIRSSSYNGKEKTWKNPIPVISVTAYTASIQFDGVNKAHLLWIGEGRALSEAIYSQVYDFSACTWGEGISLNMEDDSSLIDGVDAFALAKTGGVVMWYDFFKEKLFYSFLKEGQEPGRNYRRHGILYKKKVDLAKRRGARKIRGY